MPAWVVLRLSGGGGVTKSKKLKSQGHMSLVQHANRPTVLPLGNLPVR